MADAIQIKGLHKAYGGAPPSTGSTSRSATARSSPCSAPTAPARRRRSRSLEGFRRRDGGEVRVLGTDPQTAGLDWRNRVGIVLQSLAGTRPADPARGARQHREGLLGTPATSTRSSPPSGSADKARQPHRRPERRPAAPPRRRARHRRPARAALPRRAHHRVRPAGPARLLGPHPRPGRRRHDDPAHHALPRRGREARRPGRGHRRRPHARRRHPGPARRPQRAGGHGLVGEDGGGPHPCHRRRRRPRWPGSRPGFGRRGARARRDAALARGHLPQR